MHAAHLESQHGIHKSSVFQKTRQKMFARGPVINSANEQAGVSALPANRKFRQFLPEFACKRTSFRFALWQENANRWIAPPQKRRQLAVDQNDSRAADARHRVMSRQIRLLVF